MSRLRAVSIEGFKTFPSLTTVYLADGVTGIVGPNGCGKSNLIDAIAWATGLRSWRTLRGEKMENVIFHGSDSIPRSEKATVRLLFDNSDRALPIDLEEVEVSREITRTSGSTAAINRVPCQLREVQTLLAGTGLVGGFSLVRQGVVDKLVLSPPEELGRWIEEAANIAGFRARKREALGRLEKTRHRLAEMEKTLRKLRSEAGRIRRSAERAKERAELEARVLLIGHQITALERREFLTQLARLNDDRKITVNAEQELAQERQRNQEERKALEEDLARQEEAAAASAAAGAPQAPPIDPETLAERIGRIRSISKFLDETATELEREGPEAWPEGAKRLERAVHLIRETKAPGSSPQHKKYSRPTPEDTPLARLRKLSSNQDTLEARYLTLKDDLARFDSEIARVEEKLAALPPGPPEGDPDIPTDVTRVGLASEHKRLEGLIKRIGPVDETAGERLVELEKEIQVTQKAHADIREAQGQLDRFIEQLDDNAGIVFRHTLEHVGRRLQEYVTTLFGGGTVRLFLSATGEEKGPATPDLRDEEHPPPVEIAVKLPRKGECPLTLLSGGERSLTGIALVLALAAGNDTAVGRKARLLIFDEVDAALDDANTARFARLVRTLGKDHQVLCVTHNRITLHEASRMIGVTAGIAHGTTVLVETQLPTGGGGEHDTPSQPSSTTAYQSAENV